MLIRSEQMSQYIKIFLIVCIIFLLWNKEVCMAAIEDDPIRFYNTYGENAVFTPISEENGAIYMASSAYCNSKARIRFRTIGWKISVRNSWGMEYQCANLKLGGNALTLWSEAYSNGYVYEVYKLNEQFLRNFLYPASVATIQEGRASIYFDAINTILVNGVPQGSMDDSGNLYGEVYTTYDGIAGATGWSANTREALKSYYNKQAQGLLCTVSVTPLEGIASIQGGGTFLYGTTVKLYATPKQGYQFSGWSGAASGSANPVQFIANKNSTVYASGKRNEVEICYHRNLTTEDTVTTIRKVSLDDSKSTFWFPSWEQVGHYANKWIDKKGESYSFGSAMQEKWLASAYPRIDLYCEWKWNEYVIHFDGNGSTIHVPQDMKVSHQGTVCIAQEVPELQGASFQGWARRTNCEKGEYQAKEAYPVTEILGEAAENSRNGLQITLYAIWDNIPAIYAQALYFSVDDAKSKRITEQLLASYATTYDKEDGSIPYGVHEQNQFTLLDYSEEEFEALQQGGSVSITYFVKDSGGNEAYEQVLVHIVDTTVKKSAAIYGRPRFISNRYYKKRDGNLVEPENGGLGAHSIWRVNPIYARVLEKVM